MTEPLSDEELAAIEDRVCDWISATPDDVAVARLCSEVRRLRARLQLQIDATITACEDASAWRERARRMGCECPASHDIAPSCPVHGL